MAEPVPLSGSCEGGRRIEEAEPDEGLLLAHGQNEAHQRTCAQCGRHFRRVCHSGPSTANDSSQPILHGLLTGLTDIKG